MGGGNSYDAITDSTRHSLIKQEVEYSYHNNKNALIVAGILCVISEIAECFNLNSSFWI